MEQHHFHYDLLTEPWIPCELPDGTRQLVGIERALLNAHRFRALHDESPLVTATLHRLLLAILHRAFSPSTDSEWRTLWEAPSFDEKRLLDYMEKWRPRFDLFDAVRPFLQVSRLGEVLEKERGKKPEPSDAGRFALETSRHSGATSLFEARTNEEGISPAEAARALLAYQAYTSGGRIQNEAESWTAGPLRTGGVILLRGDSLHQTLLLNLVWQEERPANDLPPWETENPTPRGARAPKGLADELVWASRRVLLLPSICSDGEQRVTRVITAAGEKFEGPQESMFAYVVRDPKKPALALRIDPERAVWRDAHGLFQRMNAASSFRQPRALTQLATLIGEEVIPRDTCFNTDVLGLASDQAAIELWRAESMPLPSRLLTDDARVDVLRRALRLAEELAENLNHKVLGVLARGALSLGEREPHKNDVTALKRSFGALAIYWEILSSRFNEWLIALGTTEDLEVSYRDWKRILKETARETLRRTTGRLGTTARSLQAGAKAEAELGLVLHRVLDSDDASKSTAQASTEGARL